MRRQAALIRWIQSQELTPCPGAGPQVVPQECITCSLAAGSGSCCRSSPWRARVARGGASWSGRRADPPSEAPFRGGEGRGASRDAGRRPGAQMPSWRSRCGRRPSLVARRRHPPATSSGQEPVVLKRFCRTWWSLHLGRLLGAASRQRSRVPIKASAERRPASKPARGGRRRCRVAGRSPVGSRRRGGAGRGPRKPPRQVEAGVPGSAPSRRAGRPAPASSPTFLSSAACACWALVVWGPAPWSCSGESSTRGTTSTRPVLARRWRHDVVQDLLAELRVGHLAVPRNMIVTLTLWPSREEVLHLAGLGLEVAGADLGPVLHLLTTTLVLFRRDSLAALLRRLVLVLAAVHDPTDRGLALSATSTRSRSSSRAKSRPQAGAMPICSPSGPPGGPRPGSCR